MGDVKGPITGYGGVMSEEDAESLDARDECSRARSVVGEMIWKARCSEFVVAIARVIAHVPELERLVGRLREVRREIEVFVHARL